MLTPWQYEIKRCSLLIAHQLNEIDDWTLKARLLQLDIARTQSLLAGTYQSTLPCTPHSSVSSIPPSAPSA